MTRVKYLRRLEDGTTMIVLRPVIVFSMNVPSTGVELELRKIKFSIRGLHGSVFKNLVARDTGS